MGVEKEKRATRNDRQAQKRSERREQRRAARGTVDISQLNCPELVYCLEQIIRAGGALRIGATRDGGAFAFGVYGDGPDSYTDYLRPDEDVARYLAELGDYFGGMSGERQNDA